jgi:hypothetical protein
LFEDVFIDQEELFEGVCIGQGGELFEGDVCIGQGGELFEGDVCIDQEELFEGDVYKGQEEKHVLLGRKI